MGRLKECGGVEGVGRLKKCGGVEGVGRLKECGGVEGRQEEAGVGSGVGGGGEGSSGMRWKLAEDVGAWSKCPIGVCPQQHISANMLNFLSASNAATSIHEETYGKGMIHSRHNFIQTWHSLNV